MLKALNSKPVVFVKEALDKTEMRIRIIQQTKLLN